MNNFMHYVYVCIALTIGNSCSAAQGTEQEPLVLQGTNSSVVIYVPPCLEIGIPENFETFFKVLNKTLPGVAEDVLEIIVQYCPKSSDDDEYDDEEYKVPTNWGTNQKWKELVESLQKSLTYERITQITIAQA